MDRSEAAQIFKAVVFDRTRLDVPWDVEQAMGKLLELVGNRELWPVPDSDEIEVMLRRLATYLASECEDHADRMPGHGTGAHMGVARDILLNPSRPQHIEIQLVR